MKINKKIQVIIPLLFFSLALLFVVFKLLNITSSRNISSNNISDNHNRQTLSDNAKVIMYTKEGCRYCSMAKELLLKKNIDFESVDISFDTDIQRKLFEQTRQNTVPYIFIDDKFIGGYKDLSELMQTTTP